MSFCNSSLTSESSLPLSRPTLPSPTCYLYMHAVPPIIWSCLRAVPSWTCRLYGRGLYAYVIYYLPAPYFLSQLECSLLEHEFEEETCGRDVGVYLCERATATNGGDHGDDSARLQSSGVCVQMASTMREKQIACDVFWFWFMFVLNW